MGGVKDAEDDGANFGPGMTERNINSARGLLNTAAKLNNEEVEERKVSEPVMLRVVEDEDSDGSNHSHSSNLSMRSIGHQVKDDAETMIQNAIDKTSTPVKITWDDVKFSVMASD